GFRWSVCPGGPFFTNVDNNMVNNATVAWMQNYRTNPTILVVTRWNNEVLILHGALSRDVEWRNLEYRVDSRDVPLGPLPRLCRIREIPLSRFGFGPFY